MDSIVTCILSSTVGLLWNKARDKTAAKLKEGGVTDEKIREIIVGELNDIKTKLDGLSRKDLLSSYSFLREGVSLLNVFLDKSKEKCVECGPILTEALELSRAMEKLKINSEKEFEYARRRFEEARKKATEAFCNEALGIQDRIFAAKLRVISEILECLETPETAIAGCMLFLQDLHSLPALREMFAVYLNGGLKSKINRAERAENVKSIMLINYVLFQFAFKFGSIKFCSPRAWPTIKLAKRSFHPVLHWQEISVLMVEELLQPPNYEVEFDAEIIPSLSAVNSHVEVVAKYGNDIKVISKTGESKVVKLPDLNEGRVVQQHIVALAVDNSNDIYVVKRLEMCTENGVVESFVLSVLDENYNVKHDRTLDFLEATTSYKMRIAINKNKNIIMIKHVDPRVYVCDNTGQLRHTFGRDSRQAWGLSISDKNEIMIPSDNCKTIHVYTEEGGAKSSIDAPEDHEVRSVAFHHVGRKIVVLSYLGEQHSYFVLTYSETGELETSAFFRKRTINPRRIPIIASHPSGPVAVVSKRSVTFI